MAELLSSGLYIQEEPPALQTIEGVATSVAACVGVTRMGPVGEATLITSYAQFKRIFGGEIGTGMAALAVQGFFLNGGTRLYFTRTVHYDDIGDAASKRSALAALDLLTGAPGPGPGSVLGTIAGPFNLEPGDNLAVAVDGGAPATATFNAAAASQIAPGAGPYALADGQTLTVKVDDGPAQTITFHASEFVLISAATPIVVCAVINAQLHGGSASLNGGKPQISSDTRGTASRVQVTGGTANAALGFPTALASGSGNVADVNAVTAAEVKTIVEAAVTGAQVASEGGQVRISSSSVGAASSLQVLASSTADEELGLDNATHPGSSGTAIPTLRVEARHDGAYGNAITVQVSSSPSGAPSEFTLGVLDDGVVAEQYPSVSMDAASERYVERVVNPVSILVRVLDLGAAPQDATIARPANGAGATSAPFGPLAGGSDGLEDLDDNDFIGDPTAKNGLRSFDTVAEGALLIVPDRATAAVHQAMLAYCEVAREMGMFAILDPPAGLGAEGVVAYADSAAGIVNLSEFGAMYWPRIKVLNPSRAVFGPADSIVVPVSGHVAGVYARVDSSRDGGVYVPPGGVVNGRIFGVVGLETAEVLEKARRDVVYPKRVNPIAKLRGQPIAIDGVRTLRSSGAFPTVAERRGMIFIEQSIKDGLQFARLRNNDEGLRDEVNRTITAFMLRQMRAGAFRTQDPATAFFVDTSEAINPPSEVFAGKLNVRVGVATQKPAEFIIISFSQDTRAIETELAAAAG